MRFYTAKHLWKEKQLNHSFSLYSYFGALISNKKGVKIADFGSGMFCPVGSTWPNTKVEIYPSDALANEFNQILEDAGVKALIPVKRIQMIKTSIRLEIIYQRFISYLPILTRLVDISEGPILKLGMGFSTTILDMMCRPTKRPVVSYENDPF